MSISSIRISDEYTLEIEDTHTSIIRNSYGDDVGRLEARPAMLLYLLVSNYNHSISTEKIADYIWNISDKEVSYPKPEITKYKTKIRDFFNTALQEELPGCDITSEDNPSHIALVSHRGIGYAFKVDSEYVVKEKASLPAILTKKNPIFADEESVIHRESEIHEIIRILKSGKKNVLISGFGGIGKTSIAAILYAWASNNYDTIGWVEYRGNLKKSILASVELDENIEDQNRRWESLKRRIKNDKSHKVLFIDNVDRDVVENQDPLEDEELNLITGWPNISIILTSRLCEISGYKTYSLGYLGCEDNRKTACMDLFYFYYKNGKEYRKQSSERSSQYAVETLVELSGYHTYAIELLAKSAYYERSLDDYLKEIQKTGFNFPHIPVRTSHKNIYDVAAVQLRKLFDMRTRNEIETRVLWDFSVLPNTALSVEEMQLWLGYSIKDVDSLVMEGWLLFQNGFTIHPLVRETIFLALEDGKAPKGTLHLLVEHFAAHQMILNNESYSSALRLLDVAERLLKYVPIDDKEMNASMLYYVGLCFFKKPKRRQTSIFYLEKSLAIYEQLVQYDFDKYVDLFAENCYQLGYIKSSTKGYRESCDKNLQEAMYLWEKAEQAHPNQFEEKLARVYDHLGYVWTDIPEKRVDAEILLMKAIHIRTDSASLEKSRTHTSDLATTYDNLGRLLAFDSNRLDEAVEYLEKALSIRRALDKKFPGYQTSEIAWTCTNIADLYATLPEKNKESEQLYREALRLRRSLNEKNPGAYVGSIAWTCGCLANLLMQNRERREEAAELCYNAVQIYESLDEDHKGFYNDEMYQKCNRILTEVAKSKSK